jgi:hypothetical protein
MPPPTLITDYGVVGGAGSYSTWAKLRTPVGRNVTSTFAVSSVIYNGHSVQYDFGFTAADGSLLKSDVYYFTCYSPPPAFHYDEDPDPDAVLGYFYLFAGIYDGNRLDKDDMDTMVGQTVTLSGGSFVITTDAWSSTPGAESVNNNLGDISTISALASF